EWHDEPAHTNGVRVSAVDESWRGLLETTEDRKGRTVIASPHHNAIVFLKPHPAWAGVVVRDAFRDRVTCLRPPPWSGLDMPTTPHEAWTDSDTLRLSLWYRRAEAVTISRERCEGAVTIVAESNERHAVRDYLRGLTWDGK